MNYGNIKEFDIANGEGVRISLFVSGCTHHCKGCFQPQTWDFNYGEPFTEETENHIIQLLAQSYIDGLSLLGGEPFEKVNQRALLPFLRRVQQLYPKKTIWCYSGYTFDTDLKIGGSAYCECTDEMLSLIDILVDGEFIEEQKDISLDFRGSSNQRIIDVHKSLAGNETVIWKNRSREL